MKSRWTLRDLVDFEGLLGKVETLPTHDPATIRESARGLDGAQARRIGMKAWLNEHREGGGELAGEIWAGGRALVGALVIVGMFLAGVGAMTGMLDQKRMAFHVPVLLGVSVILPVLILVVGLLTFLFRSKLSGGFGFVPGLLGVLSGRLGGGGRTGWWRKLRQEGGRGWEALGWNLVRLSQVGALMFSAGMMAGLLGCIWFMEIGFFWESTTPAWMAKQISRVVFLLSIPWAWAFPDWVPLDDVILGSFLENGRGLDGRMSSTATWYKFFFAAIFTWGVLPRLFLWAYAAHRERKALDGLDFQAKRHRELWREIMGTRRADVSEEPLDGVLVLDVGGTGLAADDLRGFMLRRLRVNPGEWFEVGVWDGRGEADAASSIQSAPSGVVLLAEGWALAPARMTAIYRQIRDLAGTKTLIHFLVVNVGSDGKLSEVMEEEKKVWRDFTDGLADAGVEVFFHDGEGAE